MNIIPGFLLPSSLPLAAGAAVLLPALAVAAALIVRAGRRHTRELREAMTTIDTLMAEKKELDLKVGELTARLSEMAQGEGCGLSAEDSENLGLMLLEKEAETKFRKSFSKLHPGFLRKLNERYPALSPGNELICMLIYLGQTTDEIALTLGISRESVNKARYRIRQRMGLAKDVELDSVVKQI